jgi:hypothetical protein
MESLLLVTEVLCPEEFNSFVGVVQQKGAWPVVEELDVLDFFFDSITPMVTG